MTPELKLPPFRTAQRNGLAASSITFEIWPIVALTLQGLSSD